MVFTSNDPVTTILESGESHSTKTQTRLICTLGPASCEVDILEQLLNEGMKAVRFDLSWATAEWCESTLANLRTAEKNTDKVCAVIVETAGPEIEAINIPSEDVAFKAGTVVKIDADAESAFSSSHIPVNYLLSLDSVAAGDTIVIDRYLATGDEDSTLYVTVDSVEESALTCSVQNDCTFGPHAILKVHISQLSNKMPILSVNDSAIIPLIKDLEFDFLSLSFCRNVADIQKARQFLNTQGMKQVKIIAKIENTEGLVNHVAIIESCDAIVIARGALGVDLPAEKVFVAQKMLIKAANIAGKTVITTRVVDTMVHAPRPTRAEATDVANLVLDGTDGILLGVETFKGVDPVNAARTVLQICIQAERCFDSMEWYITLMDNLGGFQNARLDKSEALASSAVRAATKLDAKAIVAFTITGRTPRLLSKYKSSVPILSVVCESQQQSSDYRNIADLSTRAYRPSDALTMGTPEAKVNCDQIARQANLLRGVIPVTAEYTKSNSTAGTMTDCALRMAKEKGLVKDGDRVVVSQCPRHDQSGQFVEAGIIKFVVVGEDAQMLNVVGSMNDMSSIVGQE